MTKQISRHPIFYMTIGVIAAGGASVFVKGASAFMPVLFMGGLRFLAQGFFFLGFYSSWSIKDNKKFYRAAAINTILLTVSVILWLLALERVQAINVVVGGLLVPIFIYVGSVLFLKEPSSPRALSGTLVALVGAILLLGEPLITNSGNISTELIGNVLILLSVLTTSAEVVHTKSVYRYGNYKALLSIRSLCTGTILLVIVAMSGQMSTITYIPSEAVVYLVLFILGNAIIGTSLFYSALQYTNAENSAPIMYLDVLTGVVLGVLLLGESFTPMALVGSLVIIGGLLVAHPIHIHRFLYFINPHHKHHEGFKNWLKAESVQFEKSIKRWL